MTDRELIQQAFDAMLNFPNDISDDMFESIKSLRARLAQPEQEIEPDRDHVEDDGCPTEKAVLQRFWREHQAQPEQEPVAWRQWVEGNPKLRGHWMLADPDVKDKCLPQGKWQPLYTAPPQREWQGLTDEEMRKTVDGYFEFDGGDMWGSYRAIEAKLKEKNGFA